jgi:RIP metalloprotease RseP
VSETIPPGTPVPPDDDRPGDDVEVEVREREPKWFDRITDPLGQAGETPALRATIVLVALAYAAFVSLWLFAVIVVIALTLFVHELGHFLVAKRNGMKVTEFFLGVGPRIWSFRRGETEYGLKIVPVAAYVKIIGMSNLEEVAPEDEARSYRAQSYWKRMPVVLAGPAVNIVVGIVLLFVVYLSFGMVQPSTTVDAVSPGSGAAAAGLLPGDDVISIDGIAVDDFDELRSVVEGKGGSEVDMLIVRDGSEMVVPATVGWGVSEDVAKALDLARGDRITQVGDIETSSWSEVVTALAQAQGQVRLVVDTGLGEGAMVVDAPITLPEDGSIGLLGLRPTSSTVVHKGLLESGGQVFGDIGQMVSNTGEVARRLFSPSGIAEYASKVANGGDDERPVVIVEPLHPIGVTEGGAAPEGFTTGSSSDIDEDRPSSILGIVDAMTQMGERAGWAGVLAGLAMVNIILGLLNLIPLLPFDGGHIAVATYEAVRGRIAHRPYRVDMAKLLPVTYAVLAFFLLFGLSAMYLDVVDPQKL